MKGKPANTMSMSNQTLAAALKRGIPNATVIRHTTPDNNKWYVFNVGDKNCYAFFYHNGNAIGCHEGPFSAVDNWHKFPAEYSRINKAFEGLTTEHLVFSGKFIMVVQEMQRIAAKQEPSPEEQAFLAARVHHFTTATDKDGNTIKARLFRWASTSLADLALKQADTRFLAGLVKALDSRPFSKETVLSDLLFLVEACVGNEETGFSSGLGVPTPSFPKFLGRLPEWDVLTKMYGSEDNINETQKFAVAITKNAAYLDTPVGPLYDNIECHIELSRSYLTPEPDNKLVTGDNIWAVSFFIGDPSRLSEEQRETLSVKKITILPYFGKDSHKKRVMDLMGEVKGIASIVFKTLREGSRGLLASANKEVFSSSMSIPDVVTENFNKFGLLDLLKRRFDGFDPEANNKRACVAEKLKMKDMPELMWELQKMDTEVKAMDAGVAKPWLYLK